MHQEKILVLFVLNTTNINQKGVCPLSCRITINNKRKQFATGLFVNPNHWQSKLQQVSVQEPNHKYINTKLERIHVKLYNIALVFQLQGLPCKPDDIFKEYKGIPPQQEAYILSTYRKYVARIHKLVGVEIKQNTYEKFVYVGNHLEAFIRWQFKKADFPLKELSLRFLDDLDYYLKTEKSI